MPPFDDDDLDQILDGPSPITPQDQGVPTTASPSIDDWLAPVLGAPPRPVTQLGLPSTYWRDINSGVQTSDHIGGALNQKTQQLWNRVFGQPVPAPDDSTLVLRTDQPPARPTTLPFRVGYNAPQSHATLLGESSSTQSSDSGPSSNGLPAGPDAPAYRAPVYPWEDPAKRANPPGTAGVPIAIDDEYSKLPFEMIMTVGAAGMGLDAVRNNVGESPIIQNLVKNVPSWAAADAARPMSGQAEMFVPSENTIVLANSGAHDSDSANLVFHAVAHAYGKASGNADQSQDFKDVWSVSRERLPDKYYSGDGKKMTDLASTAAEEARAQKETYAESLARFLSGAPNFTPELDRYWQNWSKAKGW